MSGINVCLICTVLVSLGVLVDSYPTITTKHIIDPNSLNDYNFQGVKFTKELGSSTRGLVSDLPALPAVPKLPAMPTPLELLIKHPEVAGLALGALG